MPTLAATNPAERTPEEFRMSLSEHLGELRSRLLRVVISVLVLGAGSLVFAKTLYGLLMRPVLLSLPPEASALVYTSAIEEINVYMKVGLYGGVFLTTPVILYQLWGFVSPGLYEKERKLASPFIVFGTLRLDSMVLLINPIFQAELDRANANQDRQIYPKIEPGPEPNTTSLDLKVKDRLPLHAKFDFNNQSSPGTPEMRLNASAVYNNLWQLEQSVGVQYSFSPERFKSGNDWEFYDRPLVANYSGFYRLPFGNAEALADVVATAPGTFGYDEASRKFQLPPSSGQAELNFYASRSAIDTGLMTVFSTNVTSTATNSIDRRDVQQDLTVNQDIGARFSVPVPATANLRSGLSGGLDYKSHELMSHKTNTYIITHVEIDDEGNHGHPTTNIIVDHIYSPVPSNGVTRSHLDYLTLALRYDASLNDRLGVTSFGLGLNLNAWYSGTLSNLHKVTGSSRGSGGWFIINPSLSRDFLIHTNWTLSLRADGQWASEPLISNEQFGVGGVASVRGYREGDVFGDTGWHVSIEQKTPGHFVGMVAGNQPLTIRGSVFMDYAESYLLDPQGRNSRVPLWGTGFGIVAAVGFHWEARLIFGWPLESTPSTPSGQPRFNFSLTAQF